VLKAGNRGALGFWCTYDSILIDWGGQLGSVLYPLNYLWCPGRSRLDSERAKVFFPIWMGREFSDDMNSRHGRGTDEVEWNGMTSATRFPPKST
jgi:hypothetical protein